MPKEEKVTFFKTKLRDHTSKDWAREAISLAPKSMPTIQAIPATNAANTAAYLCKRSQVSNQIQDNDYYFTPKKR